MEISHVFIAGGDLRQCYLAEFLYQCGMAVTCLYTPSFFHSSGITVFHGTDIRCHDQDILGECHCLACPVPFTRDGIHPDGTDIPLSHLPEILPEGCIIAGGNIPAWFTRTAALHHIKACDYLTFDSLLTENALLTAEGALETVLRETPFALSETTLLITGGGRCGQALAKLFTPLCHKVSLWQRSDPSLPQLVSESNVIINTVPARIFSGGLFEYFRPDAYLFDLASAPGCIDNRIAATLPFSCFLCPGLPGKTAPKSAGAALGRCLTRHIL